MTSREQAEAMIEMKDNGDGTKSLRFIGQNDLLWHSGDAYLMEARKEYMVHSIAKALDDAKDDTMRLCTKLVRYASPFIGEDWSNILIKEMYAKAGKNNYR